MVTKPEQKDAEVRHVKSALKANGYKEWAFKTPHPKTSPTPHVTPQGARPAPAWAYLISEVHPKNWPEFRKKHGVGAYHHLKQKSPRTAVGEHEHPIKMDDVKMIAREDNMWRRKIRESIDIRTRHPAFNRDQGYDLPPSMTNCCHLTAVPAVMWPRRISLKTLYICYDRNKHVGEGFFTQIVSNAPLDNGMPSDVYGTPIMQWGFW